MTDYGGVSAPRPELNAPLETRTALPFRLVNPKALDAAAAAAASSGWTNVTKPVDEARVSNAVLANDGHLLIAMLANTKYHIKGSIVFDTTAAGDFKYAIVGPVGASLIRIFRRHVVPGTTAYVVNVDTGVYTPSTSVAGVGTVGGHITLEIVIHNGATAGTFAFQWAQDTSDAGSTIVRAMSYLEYRTA